MRSLLNYRDRDLLDPSYSTDLFWFEETVPAERLGLPVGPDLRYWSGSTGWPNCAGYGFLFYAWISAVFDSVVAEPQYSFVCLNGNPRPHRRSFLDHLWDLGLFDRGIISWAADSTALWQDHVQGWLGQDQFPTHSLPVIAPPVNAWGLAAFSVVTETAVEGLDISEKTFQCVSAGQPFLVLGCRGLHAWLLRLGFQLLPGVNYAFDREPDPVRRSQLLAEEIARLCTVNPVQLRAQFQPAADRNRRHFAALHRRLRLPFAVSDYDLVGPAALRQIKDLQDLQARYRLYTLSRDCV